MSKKSTPTIWQKPNIPIVGWVVFLVLGHVLPAGDWEIAASYLSFGFIFTWAYLEITQGINNLRRILGAVVLIWSICSKLH